MSTGHTTTTTPTKEEQPEKKDEQKPEKKGKQPKKKEQQLTKKEEQQPEKEQQPTAEAAGEHSLESSDEETGNKEKIDAEEADKKSLKEETIVINPRFSDNLSMLDEDGFFDVTIEFAEQKGMIRAHQVVLSQHSNTMRELFQGHQVDAHCTYNAEAKKVEWEILGGDKDAYRIAMEQCIKFCYGAPLHVSPMTAAATIDVLFRLKLNGGQKFKERVEQHMVELAEEREGFIPGSFMLHCCAEYEHAGYSGFTTICTTLAKTVLTPENIEKHKQTVVDKCLMELVPAYLDRANYGSPHKEFSVRKKYVTKHQGDLSDVELREVINKCTFESLTNSELIEMRNLCGTIKGVTESVVLDAYSKALSDCEARLAQEQRRLEEAEKQVKECESFV